MKTVLLAAAFLALPLQSFAQKTMIEPATSYCASHRDNMNRAVQQSQSPKPAVKACEKKLIEAANCCAGYSSRQECFVPSSATVTDAKVNKWTDYGDKLSGAALEVQAGLEKNISICVEQYKAVNSADCKADPENNNARGRFTQRVEALNSCLRRESDVMAVYSGESMRSRGEGVDSVTRDADLKKAELQQQDDPQQAYRQPATSNGQDFEVCAGDCMKADTSMVAEDYRNNPGLIHKVGSGPQPLAFTQGGVVKIYSSSVGTGGVNLKANIQYLQGVSDRNVPVRILLPDQSGGK